MTIDLLHLKKQITVIKDFALGGKTVQIQT